MKWVFVVKKVENGVFFVKRCTFPQRKVHYVQYQYLLFLHFTFYLFGVGGGCRTPLPPGLICYNVRHTFVRYNVTKRTRAAPVCVLVVLEVLMSAVQSI